MTTSKVIEGENDLESLNNLSAVVTLLYTDRSKDENNTPASVWHCIQAGKRNRVLFEGKYKGGDRADIEDREIHARQEALGGLRLTTANVGLIYLCVDNQNALRSLSGGQGSGREYIRKSLQEIETLRQRGFEMLGKWTTNHQNIPGNDRADTLAKEALQMNKFERIRTMLTWAKSQSRQILHRKWDRQSKPEGQAKRFLPTINMPRHASGAIAKRQCELTRINQNPLREALNCEYSNERSSARNGILDCPTGTKGQTKLYANHTGHWIWDSITNDNIQTREILSFLNEVGIINPK
ncbi:hypothetical protein Q9L58_010461 [Maublancomyces gigas]|uniref:RNase H type-1 domain-containing protein n=1 Tax=Discina gigas TaxID=1032678 RepID=A0ABR3G416_9PEZI